MYVGRVLLIYKLLVKPFSISKGGGEDLVVYYGFLLENKRLKRCPDLLHIVLKKTFFSNHLGRGMLPIVYSVMDQLTGS